MKFLIVDDDLDIIKMTEKLLGIMEQEVFKAENALDAIDILNQEDIDILISDATMPEYSGFDLIRSLKKNDKFEGLTIAMLTGRREKEDIQQAMDLGVQDYIVKPIEPEVFFKKIESLIKKHKFKREKLKSLKKPTGTLTAEITVLRITDVGVSISSSMSFETGSIVELEIEELQKNRLYKKRFRTIFSKPILDSKENLTEFIMMDLSLEEKNILEQISNKNASKKKAA